MQQVFIEVKFESLEDAETFHDALRDFVKEYQERMGKGEYVDSGIQDVD